MSGSAESETVDSVESVSEEPDSASSMKVDSDYTFD